MTDKPPTIHDLLPPGYRFVTATHDEGGLHGMVERLTPDDEPNELVLNEPIVSDIADGTPGNYATHAPSKIRTLVRQRGVEPVQEVLRQAIVSGQWRPDTVSDDASDEEVARRADEIVGSLVVADLKGKWDGLADYDMAEPDPYADVVLPASVKRERYIESLRESLAFDDTLALHRMVDLAHEDLRARQRAGHGELEEYVEPEPTGPDEADLVHEYETATAFPHQETADR